MTFAEKCACYGKSRIPTGGKLDDGGDESSDDEECGDDVPPNFGGDVNVHIERIDKHLEPFTYNGKPFKFYDELACSYSLEEV